MIGRSALDIVKNIHTPFSIDYLVKRNLLLSRPGQSATTDFVIHVWEFGIGYCQEHADTPLERFSGNGLILNEKARAICHNRLRHS